jgi:hypothetical protein
MMVKKYFRQGKYSNKATGMEQRTRRPFQKKALYHDDFPEGTPLTGFFPETGAPRREMAAAVGRSDRADA